MRFSYVITYAITLSPASVDGRFGYSVGSELGSEGKSSEALDGGGVSVRCSVGVDCSVPTADVSDGVDLSAVSPVVPSSALRVVSE